MTERAEVAPADPRETKRPGWLELVVGLAVLAAVAYGTPRLLDPLGITGLPRALTLAALSGVAGILGFAAAVAVRRIGPALFGLRSTSMRWLLWGVAGGLLALIVSRVIGVIIMLTGAQPETIQDVYTESGSSGAFSVVLSLLFLAVLTPLGEELTFRGVVTTVLLRYGAVVGVVGSSLIFAIMHGINVIFFTALVVGLVAGEMRRRSGSVWPSVVVHVVNNGVSQLIALALAGAL